MNNKEVTRNSYNSIAQLYYKEYKDDISDLKYIDDFLMNCKKKILDLGCGMGHYSKYIKEKGFIVTGIDFSENMLEIARESSKGINFILSDVCDLPSDLDKNFDGVLIAYLIQHLSKEETRKLLISLHDFILDDCNLLVFFNLGEGETYEKEPFNPNFEYVIKQYKIDEICDLFESCGYVVLKYFEKPCKYDEFSLCPSTMILYAKNNLEKKIS